MKKIVKNLCSVNADVYLQWKMQLDHVLKNRTYERSKAKFDIVEEILDGDLLEWKLWRTTESEKEKYGTFQKKDTEEEYKKKYKEWDSDLVFKYCLEKVYNYFIKKYDARNQEAYMRGILLKPKSLFVDAMSSRLNIFNNYLTSFPSPDNKSFS